MYLKKRKNNQLFVILMIIFYCFLFSCKPKSEDQKREITSQGLLDNGEFNKIIDSYKEDEVLGDFIKKIELTLTEEKSGFSLLQSDDSSLNIAFYLQRKCLELIVFILV